MLRPYLQMCWLVVFVLGGCTSFPSSFECNDDAQCQTHDAMGTCVMNACAFNDTGCGSGLRFDESAPAVMGNACVPNVAADASVDRNDEGPFRNECGGATMLPSGVGDPCGRCLMGTFGCDGTEELRCENEPTIEDDATDEGAVSASTTFGAAYPATLSVDGSLQTSWFSAGSMSEPSGRSTYDWVVGQDECIVGIRITGNERHSNTNFREDFGFEQVTVQVLDSGGGAQYSQAADLSGTPDPPVDLSPNVAGRTVRLEFTGHESSDCGGFSELIVTVARRN